MKYILSQLTQVSAWTGFCLILATLFTPRWFLLLLGVGLLFGHDDNMKTWVRARAPGISNFIQSFLDD